MLQQVVTQNVLGKIMEKYLTAYRRWLIARALLLPKGGNNDLRVATTFAWNTSWNCMPLNILIILIQNYTGHRYDIKYCKYKKRQWKIGRCSEEKSQLSWTFCGRVKKLNPPRYSAYLNLALLCLWILCPQNTCMAIIPERKWFVVGCLLFLGSQVCLG